MLNFFNKIVDRVEDAALDYLEKYLDSDMKPALRDAIQEQVTQFRTGVVDKVPAQVGRDLKDASSNSDASRIEAMLAKALSGKVETLLEGLLKYYGPEVDRLTGGLTDTITDQSMTKVKSYLNVAGSSPEPGSRDITLPGVGTIDITETVGKLLNLKSRLPQLERELHTQFQPIAGNLKTTLWEKFVQTLNAVLGELFPWLNVPASRDLVVNQQQDRGWFSDKIEDIEQALKSKISEKLPELYEAMREAVEEIIAGLLKILEDMSVSKAMAEVHDIVKKLDLMHAE